MFDLVGEVGTVQIGVLGVDLAVDVGDLGLEEIGDGGADLVGRDRELDRTAIRNVPDGFFDASAHERLRRFRPRDAEADVVEVVERPRLELGREDPEHLLALLHRARHRPDVVEARRQRKAPVRRDEVEGRLEADDAAARRRDPDRAARVGADCGVGKTRGERSRRAAARTACDPSRSDRIRDRPEVRVLRGDPVRELVQVRLADVHVPGRFQAADRLRGLGRHVFDEDRRPVRGHEPGGVEEILDGEADPLAVVRWAREEDPV